MSTNIVVLSGSPRREGNTAHLVEAFIAGATAANKTVTSFRVAGLQIGGCRGCFHCFKHQGVCIQKDDMPPVLDALRKADALVLASPVYYFGITAQLKLAIDRFFALHEFGIAVQRAALLITCGDPSETAAASSISMFRQICSYQKWKEAGVIVAPGLHTPGEIEGRAQLELARRLARIIHEYCQGRHFPIVYPRRMPLWLCQSTRSSAHLSAVHPISWPKGRAGSFFTEQDGFPPDICSNYPTWPLVRLEPGVWF